MDGLLQNPAVHGGVVPFILGLVLTLAIRYGGGSTFGPRVAILAVGLSFLFAYWMLEGIAPFPPPASKQKIFYLAALAIAAGFGLEITGASRKAMALTAILFPLAALLWLAHRQLFGTPTTTLLITLALLYAASLIVFWRLDAARRDDGDGSESQMAGLGAPSILLVASFGAAIVSLIGAFIGLAQLLVATGAILGGYMIFNYLLSVRTGKSLPFGPLGAVGVGGIWLTCIYVIALFGQSVNKAALAVVLVCFLLDPAARRIRPAQGVTARIVRPFVYGAIVAIPAIAAAAYVLATAEPDSGY